MFPKGSPGTKLLLAQQEVSESLVGLEVAPLSPAPELSWGELIFVKTLHQDTESSAILSRDPKSQSPAYLGILALVIVPQTIKVLSLGLQRRA